MTHLNARDRILQYLMLNCGKVCTEGQIEAAAGIREWERRIRELRRMGYGIDSAVQDPQLRVGEYRLVSPTPIAAAPDPEPECFVPASTAYWRAHDLLSRIEQDSRTLRQELTLRRLDRNGLRDVAQALGQNMQSLMEVLSSAVR